MWQEYKFEDIPELELKYKSDAKNFYVICRSSSVDLVGASIYVHCGDASLNLGTLSKSETGCALSKTYPESYMLSAGVDPLAISHFTANVSTNHVLPPLPKSNDDPTLLRARQVLESLKGSSPNAEERKKHISAAIASLNRFSKVHINILEDFVFYKIDDIKETFSLSSVSHIIYTHSFMQCYAAVGYWLFGICAKKGVFAICAEASASCSNPMTNAMDCVSVIKKENTVYYVVGIELCDDGQYFCKLTD